MRYVYPVALERDADGNFVATARDLPEAITDGTSEQEALHEMREALAAALAGYSLKGQGIPVPSDVEPGEYLVPVAPLVAAKLALRAAMREEGLSNVALAQQLGISEGAVRRLVDPDHTSQLDRIVNALNVLGHGLIIEDQTQSAA